MRFLRSYLTRRIKILNRKADDALASDFLRASTYARSNSMPVILVSYNNFIYISDIITQLNQFDILPIIIDNSSTADETRLGLLELAASGRAQVLFCSRNLGHMVGFGEAMYSALPTRFAYSDPDLKLNAELPNNFLDQLSSLTDLYSVFKAGFSLDFPDSLVISEKKFSFSGPLRHQTRAYSPKEWEDRFWRFRLSHPTLEVWAATIDTTFAIYNKAQ